MENKTNIVILVVVLAVYGLNQLVLKNLGINSISLYRSNMQVTSLKYLTLITIFLSFLGEYIAIFLRPGSVSDWWDVVCYFIGMFVYYLITNIIVKPI